MLSIFHKFDQFNYRMDVEIQLFPRKVYINTLSSTLIDHSSHILPQWITQSQINYVSAYEFASYNIEQQSTKIIPREQGETEVMGVQFKAEMNEINCVMHYIFRKDSSFYLVRLPASINHPKILIYCNQNEQRQQIVQQFIDYLMNEEKIESRKSIISRTQKIIEQINEQQRDGEQSRNNVMSSIKELIIVHECNFALLVVQMSTKSGLMLLDLNKSNILRSNHFYCPIHPVTHRTNTYPPIAQQNETARIIYLFEDQVISVHRTKDLTKFILHTNTNILLIKINYETMEMNILHRVESTRKVKYLSVDVGFSGEDEVVMVMCQMSKMTIFQKLQAVSRRQMKMFAIGDKKLTELKARKNDSKSISIQSQKKPMSDRDEHLQKQAGNVKFSGNVIESRYEIEQTKQQEPSDDINRGILMKVFNEVLQSQKQIQKETISEKEKSLKKIGQPSSRKSMSTQKYQTSFIKDIGGFTCNQNIVLIWQKKTAIVHVYKIISAKEQEQRYRVQLEQKKNKRNSQLQKEDDLKQAYIQLLGKHYPQKKEEKIHVSTIIEYQCRIDLGLSSQVIKKILLSPGNANVLIISGNGNRQSILGNPEQVQFDVFQLDLYRQLGNQDPSIFFKPFKNIYMPKPIQTINTSLVKEFTLFLTGNLVHSLENQLLDGALSFDVHPYNIFLAVSFGFTTKVYALEGNQKLTTLYALNGQGMKQVKYSPLGNHLCILFSKYIKIVDSYSFTTMFVINEKNTNFLKCFYSFNGLQFYSLNEHHQFVVYNTFDYNKIDSIKPSIQIAEFKPISIKAFLKHSLYCFVLENGNIFAKYKSSAVVLVPQQLFSYRDGQLVNCIEIDQKNGILFTGCKSGIVRAHLWPEKDNTFDNYTQIRTSFSPITYLALSNTSPIIFIGHQNGNITKSKYIIQRQRQKKLNTDNDRSAMIGDRNTRYLNLQHLNTIEKTYKFVLQNRGILTQELPQKLRLEYKLSEVILKLNGEMKKLKCNIQQELEQKAKLSIEKVDIGLLHHINQMITTKLYSQLREQTENNNKQLQQLKKTQADQLKQILSTQNQLLKQKCFEISDFSATRKKMKEEFDLQIQREVSKYSQEHSYIQHHVVNAQKNMECQEDKLFFIPNDYIEQYEDHKIKLQKQLQDENKKHFEYIKSCAYIQTAIKDLYAKKIRSETKQIKVQLQKDEIQIQLAHKLQQIALLRQQIKEAELNLHRVQNQSAIIKSSAQFKRVANIEEMNDACSHKLWVKDKLENEIGQLSDSLAQIEELLTNKGNDVAQQIAVKKSTNNIIKNKHEEIQQYKYKLKETKFGLMQTHNKLKKVNPIGEYKSIMNSSITKESKLTVKSSENYQQKTMNTDRLHTTSKSGKFISVNSKNIDSYNKVINMQTKFMKSNLRAHQKKIKKIEKENGQLLFQYQKLKWEARDLKDRQYINQRTLQNANKQKISEQLQDLYNLQTTTRLQLSKTPFQKYLQLKNAQNQRFKTATSTPCHWRTSSPSRLCTDRIN